MRQLYFECNMGAAGDMLMGALYDVCPDKEGFLARMESLGLPGVHIHAKRTAKSGISGIRMEVHVHGEVEESMDVQVGHEYEDGREHGHSHSHEDGCEQEHDHFHEHEHGHDHDHSAADNEQSHDDHHHDQENGHIHSHDHPHDHEHSHEHGHDHEHSHSHNNLASICEWIGRANVSDKVKADALGVFSLIADAEASVHGTTPDNVHFHEVGTLDALADILGCCLLMEMIAPDRAACSPIHVGSGFVRCAHGVLPVPAPATANILRGVPVYSGEIRGELCTPTGAALLKHFSAGFGPMPAMTLEGTGYGFGKKEFPVLNCVRVMVGQVSGAADGSKTEAAGANDGQSDAAASGSVDGQAGSSAIGQSNGRVSGSPVTVAELRCNLDDMTGEALGVALETLMENGALDVFFTPIQMKKNRPGVMLTCLCKPETRDSLAALMLKHTTTLGVRASICDRMVLNWSIADRETQYGTIRVKESAGYGVTRVKPEFEDVQAAARKAGVSFLEVYRATMGARRPE